jgi:hypothetical protein
MPGKKAATKTAKLRTATKKSKTGAKPKSKKALPSAAGADFAPVFSALKDVMAAYAGELHVLSDEPRKFYLVTKSLSWRGGPMYFGAVIQGKAYVSYHLMPLYACPDLVKQVSPELKRRMQGKSCFNFRQRDEALLSELSELTKSGLERYRAKKFL